MGHPLIWLLAFLAAARLTRFCTDDVLTEPLRNAWERRYKRRTQEAMAAANDADQEHASLLALANPDARRVKAAAARKRSTFRRFERTRVLQWFTGCPWCIGFWVFAVVTALTWLALGLPGQVLDGPAWFTLPAAALGGNWLYALAASWVDRTDE